MHVVGCVCAWNFGTKFFLRRGEFKTRENSNFLKKGKIVILIKIRNFSRSRMTKRTSSLKSSHKIWLLHRFLSNSKTVGICTFFEETSIVQDTLSTLSGTQCAMCQAPIQST